MEQNGHPIEENQLTSFFPKETWQRMNRKMMTLTFFELYTGYVKKLGVFFFHIYLLTYLKTSINKLLDQVIT